MKTAVIISTYNAPRVLRLCLYGFVAQKDADFEIVIADDGSDDRTKQALAHTDFDVLRDRNHLKHVWHEDTGFRLSAIRNLAINSTDADYLIFIDGDCIPRDDYVASHQNQARPGYFMAGGRIDIPEAVHEKFQPDEISSNHVFDIENLIQKDASLAKYRWRLSRNNAARSILNILTWRYCVFAGSNSAAWRKDLFMVNGFDESFPGYGSEDRDIGIRMRNAGIKSRYQKFSFCQLHLSHPRKYFDPAVNDRNRKVFRERRRDGTTAVAHGLKEMEI